MASTHQDLPPNDSDMCYKIRERTLNLAQTAICFHYYFSYSIFMQSYDFKQKMTEQQNRTHITQHSTQLQNISYSQWVSVAPCGFIRAATQNFREFEYTPQTISATN